ncbi:MAG: hypothetical protein SGJ18_10445 [Pseudomonadota bacterium]|nr:hypothetical protein [Pseudomonadota bacterium]
MRATSIHFYFTFTVIIMALMGCSSMEIESAAQQANVAKPAGRDPASHSWSGYHWARGTNPFTLKVGNNLTTTDWRTHLSQTIGDWNSPEIFGATSTPLLLAAAAGSSNKRCAMVSGTTQVCNGKYGNNGWLGLASINIVNGEHITQGSAKMNDTYFVTAKYNNPNEKLHVVCQEIAHTFGLDHQSEDGSSQNSCMDYFSNTGANATNSVSTRPNAHDFEQLALIYNHQDTTTTVAPMATAVASQNDVSDVSDDPNTWGEFVRERSRGRNALYQKRNRDGSSTVTHVYWTEEAAARCKDCDHRFDQ